MISFLKKQNIRNYFRAGIALEGIVGKADSTQQIRTVCQIFSGGDGLFVHCAAGSDNGDNTAGTNLVQRFR